MKAWGYALFKKKKTKQIITHRSELISTNLVSQKQSAKMSVILFINKVMCYIWWFISSATSMFEWFDVYSWADYTQAVFDNPVGKTAM